MFHFLPYILLVLITYIASNHRFIHAGDAVLLAAGLTLLVTLGLTAFTFAAAKRGADFSFMGPFLFCAILLLMAFGIIRVSYLDSFMHASKSHLFILFF